MMTYLLSHPNDWDIMVTDLQRRCGRDKVKRILAELKAAGYLLVELKVHNADGQFATNHLALHETPLTDSPSTGNPSTVNPPLQYIDQQNQESQTKEIKNQSQSERERFLPEGVDPAKFIQDDPYTSPDDAPQYLRQTAPTSAVRQQLEAYSTKLGSKVYGEVMTRCGNAHSWEYVLKAFANEPMPSPCSTPPPSPAADDPTEPDGSFEEVPGNETPAIDEPVLIENPDPNTKKWAIAMSQLEIQLDRASFETWLKGAIFQRVEDGVWVIRVANTHTRDMLQYRLYREIRRVLGDVLGERVELTFEISAVQHG
ncbi:MAG: hypothetical protein H0X30_01250 [Anaerolineae bacterium]|nr:hypothetical protein [Anaerolineae bacterium]